MTKPRANIVSIIVGARGTGKTDYLKNEVVIPSLFSKKLIADTFDNSVWFDLETWNNPSGSMIKIPAISPSMIPRHKSGLYRTFSSEPEEIFRIIQKHTRNCLLIFEDASKYLEGKLDRDVKKFVYDSKQKNLDLVFVFHSLIDVPPRLIRSADTLTIFKTNEGYPPKSRYPFPGIRQAMDIVAKSENHFENVTILLN